MDADYTVEKDVYDVARRDGSLIRLKANMGLEAMMTPLLRRALSDECPSGELMETAEFFADLGGHKSKNQPVAGPQAGFSIVLNLPGQTNTPNIPNAEAIDVTPEPVYAELNADLKGDL